MKHEMGQGVATSMAQILCEELCADWERVRIDFPIADLPRYQNERNGGHDTGGKLSHDVLPDPHDGERPDAAAPDTP